MLGCGTKVQELKVRRSVSSGLWACQTPLSSTGRRSQPPHCHHQAFTRLERSKPAAWKGLYSHRPPTRWASRPRVAPPAGRGGRGLESRAFRSGHVGHVPRRTRRGLRPLLRAQHVDFMCKCVAGRGWGSCRSATSAQGVWPSCCLGGGLASRWCDGEGRQEGHSSDRRPGESVPVGRAWPRPARAGDGDGEGDAMRGPCLLVTEGVGERTSRCSRGTEGRPGRAACGHSKDTETLIKWN